MGRNFIIDDKIPSATPSSQDTVTSTENPATERSEMMRDESRGNPSRGSAKTENTNKNEDDEELRSELLQDVPDFKDNLVDKNVQQQTLPALLMNLQWSREQRWYGLGQAQYRNSLPERPKWRHLLEDETHSASRRRRTGTAVPRVEHVGDLITIDHKVLSEECESRNNHRYAVVVQVWASRWLQSYPCKTKTSQETQKSLMKFLELDRKPKVIYNDNSVKIGRSCEENFPGIIARLHHTDRRLMVLRKEQCAGLRKDVCGIVAVRSGWKMVGRFYWMLVLSVEYSRSLVWWEETLWKALRDTI